MIIETNTKPLWCPNCDAKDKRIAELEKAIEILQSKGEVVAEGEILMDKAHSGICDRYYVYNKHKQDFCFSSNYNESVKKYFKQKVKLILQIDK